MNNLKRFLFLSQLIKRFLLPTFHPLASFEKDEGRLKWCCGLSTVVSRRISVIPEPYDQSSPKVADIPIDFHNLNQ